MDLATGEIYWNQVAREIYETEAGFHPTFNQTLALYVDQSAVKSLFEKAISSGNAEVDEFLLCTAKGASKWIKLRMQAGVTVENRKMVYATIEDISHLRQLIDTLAEREQQFHHAFEYAPIGMALLSPTGAWIKVNKMLTGMLGYDKEQFLRKTFQDITHPDDLDLDLHQMYALLEDKIPSYTMEKRYYHADGRIIWVLLSVTLVKNQQDEPLYFVSQIMDISERKSIELERNNALKIIQVQNSRLLNFAHIVSHNLRSHAGNIQILTNMIGEEEDLTEKESMIGLLGITATNLLETLGHLNEVVDVGSGAQQHFKTINLLKEINKVKTILLISLKKANAKLAVRIPTDMEITGNRAYLESILLNLLTNSVKYRQPDRGLLVTITGKTHENKTSLTITDNGLGIDMNTHGEKLFGMYNTFHGNNDARGIGLFMVKNQVEVMNGTINIDSKPGEGTTFEILFPNKST